ncbi:MAG: hypothetical protein MR927_06945 [Campylobacter sp.]|nr:hypothetical protein [Campylobacter sp.]
MNYLFYPCAAAKAISHTRRTILESLFMVWLEFCFYWRKAQTTARILEFPSSRIP